jgi:hypothetical protein
VVKRSDVTAVVLTLGEPYTERALASVERQVMPAAAVVVVRDTVPFHRALNEGAARVRTPYFVQVDADMILDPTCIADLRACMGERVGVAIGFLRDPLLDRVAGVKLFRATCFAHQQFADSISPDTDFYNAIAARDWRTVYALKLPGDPSATAHVFGDHRPEYSPPYTFRKYVLQGARHRHRRAAASLRELCRRLHASRHDCALFALIGTAHGIFLPTHGDLLAPFGIDAEFDRLQAFLHAAAADARPPAEVGDLAALKVRAAWRRAYRCGFELYRRRAPGAFLAALDHLAETDGVSAWVALVGICHGLFADAVDDERVERAWALLNRVLPAPYRRRAPQLA